MHDADLSQQFGAYVKAKYKLCTVFERFHRTQRACMHSAHAESHSVCKQVHTKPAVSDSFGNTMEGLAAVIHTYTDFRRLTC